MIKSFFVRERKVDDHYDLEVNVQLQNKIIVLKKLYLSISVILIKIQLHGSDFK